MRTALVGLGLAAIALRALAVECVDPREIAYEPTVVELTGTVSIARASHPNGSQMTYAVMHLARPVSIQADGVNPINSREACVADVQLTSNETRLQKRLLASGGKRMLVRGTVLHQHTAWHMRRLVVVVLEVRG